ncbi:hypothetical protein T08_1065 [Trichinella sp. T8]|nr:hypothetical protein T08_1065 [Trichinella sp. T8]
MTISIQKTKFKQSTEDLFCLLISEFIQMTCKKIYNKTEAQSYLNINIICLSSFVNYKLATNCKTNFLNNLCKDNAD